MVLKMAELEQGTGDNSQNILSKISLNLHYMRPGWFKGNGAGYVTQTILACLLVLGHGTVYRVFLKSYTVVFQVLVCGE
jgi:hypothetical protein